MYPLNIHWLGQEVMTSFLCWNIFNDFSWYMRSYMHFKVSYVAAVMFTIIVDALDGGLIVGHYSVQWQQLLQQDSWKIAWSLPTQQFLYFVWIKFVIISDKLEDVPTGHR